MPCHALEPEISQYSTQQEESVDLQMSNLKAVEERAACNLAGSRADYDKETILL